MERLSTRHYLIATLFCRREAEFNGTTDVFLAPAHAAQLVNLERLSLYGNKLERLTHVSSLLSAKALSELNVSCGSLSIRSLSDT